MALAVKPGPLGLGSRDTLAHGTLTRGPATVPGPTGLWFVPPVYLQTKGAAPKAARKAGITVHPSSTINAAGWVKKIADSADVPSYFKTQIKSQGDVIYVTNPRKFKFPKDVIPKTWLSDWLSAFVADEWELTSGVVDVKVTKSGGKTSIVAVHHPDLATGETVEGFTKHTMTAKGDSTSALSIERGNTLPTGVTLTSGRRTIAIADRLTLDLGGTVQRFSFTDAELLDTWFHELAAHAGRFSTNQTNTHGDTTVDSHARDIAGMFPKTTTVPKVFAEIDAFLKGSNTRKKP